MDWQGWISKPCPSGKLFVNISPFNLLKKVLADDTWFASSAPFVWFTTINDFHPHTIKITPPLPKGGVNRHSYIYLDMNYKSRQKTPMIKHPDLSVTGWLSAVTP
jgi:hypothetical protein